MQVVKSKREAPLNRDLPRVAQLASKIPTNRAIPSKPLPKVSTTQKKASSPEKTPSPLPRVATLKLSSSSKKSPAQKVISMDQWLNRQSKTLKPAAADSKIIQPIQTSKPDTAESCSLQESSESSLQQAEKGSEHQPEVAEFSGVPEI